jgi:hypothetical protein
MGHGVEHPPQSSFEVGGRVELHVCSPSGTSWPVIGGTLPLLNTQKFGLFSLGFPQIQFYKVTSNPFRTTDMIPNATYESFGP